MGVKGTEGGLMFVNRLRVNSMNTCLRCQEIASEGLKSQNFPCKLAFTGSLRKPLAICYVLFGRRVSTKFPPKNLSSVGSTDTV